MKKLVSFLGTNEYVECYYQKDNLFTSTSTRFIQTAIIEMLQQEGIEMDKVYIFVTEEALGKNYEDYYSESTGRKLIGLKNIWNEKFPEWEDKLIPVSMGSGQTESEQWELFEQIYEIIEEKDELFFDITHSFRSNPVIALIISHFAKTMKGANIKRLLYGNFEVLGYANIVKELPLNERVAPIVDITSMVELLDWTIAVDSFIETGNPIQVYKLAKEKADSDYQDGNYRSIRDLADSLTELSKNLETVRGRQYEKEIGKTFNRMKRLHDLDESKLPQFSKLATKIDMKMGNFSDNEIENMWGSVIWTYEHGLYQQSVTFLSEHILTIVLKKIKDQDYFNSKRRSTVSAILKFLAQKKQLHKEKLGNNAVLIEPVKEIYKANPELVIYNQLSNIRNDINHAGMRENKASYKRLIISAETCINELEPFFKRMMEE